VETTVYTFWLVLFIWRSIQSNKSLTCLLRESTTKFVRVVVQSGQRYSGNWSCNKTTIFYFLNAAIIFSYLKNLISSISPFSKHLVTDLAQRIASATKTHCTGNRNNQWRNVCLISVVISSILGVNGFSSFANSSNKWIGCLDPEVIIIII
jgi:hypothetical protein